MWWKTHERQRLNDERHEAEFALAQVRQAKIASVPVRALAVDVLEWHRHVQLHNHFAERLRLAYGAK